MIGPIITASKRYLHWIVLSSLLLISACTGTRSSSGINNSELNVAQEYLQRAKSSDGLERDRWLLKASEALLASGRAGKALPILQQINPNQLDILHKDWYHSLVGQGLTLADKHTQAIMQFSRVSNPGSLESNQQLDFYSRFADSLSEVGRHFESAKQRMSELALVTDVLDQEAVKEILWQSLLAIPNPALYQTSLNSRDLEGWLDLAIIAKTYENNPEMLIRALEIWKGRYQLDFPDHYLPLDMTRALSVQSYDPDKLAILLPLTGSFASSAEHIKRGIMAAHYDNQNDTELVFYDTGNSSAIEQYQNAVDAGSHFVLGPLQQTEVESLRQSEALTIPVLAINRLISDELTEHENFYQFGLPIEDEVRLAAEKILNDGHEQGVLFLPEGSLGDRALIAFREIFEQNDASIQAIGRYKTGDDYAKPVQTLLGIDKSFQRHSRLQQLTGVSMEFQGRRRQDIDFVFFIADPVAGRRIKPYIDYYYAHDIDVYATSSIYKGIENPVLDNDLNRIHFPNIPFLQTDNPESKMIRTSLTSYWSDSNEGIAARLFALGYDSYQLIPELSKLKHFPNYHLTGMTGSLSVNETGQVVRSIPWARFVKGVPLVMEDKTSDVNQSH